jgi:hypothetical protein
MAIRSETVLPMYFRRLLDGAAAGLLRRRSPRQAMNDLSGDIEDESTKNKIVSGIDSLVAIMQNRSQANRLGEIDPALEEKTGVEPKRNLSISFRASFCCLRASLIDSSPAELLVLTMENLNAIATWDSLRLSDSTAYITLADLQVDNMVPDAPFPVAISRLTSQSSKDIVSPKSPLLVVGVSIAPSDSSGIVVRYV